MKIIDLGVDLGNYSTKIVGENYQDIFESRFREVSQEDIADMFGMIPNLFEFEGKSYIPQDGAFDFENRKMDRSNLRLCFAYALTLACDDGDSVNAGVGLPLKQHNIDAKPLQDLLLGDGVYKVTLNGESKTISIHDITVIPEAIGAFFSLDEELLADRGSDDITIIDIGGKTTDLCTINKFNMPVKNDTIQQGTYDHHSSILKHINSRYTSACAEMNDIQEIVADNGTFTYEGEKVAIPNQIDEVKSKQAEIIVKDVERFNTRLARGLAIITGGHGLDLFDKIKGHIKYAKIHDKPIFGNGEGFFNYVRNKRARNS